ncbi:uncharacterized protein LOC100368784 [Saccoglossus kowalevskii]|uniref:Sexual differentiation process protein isp7-like n=1 Tax=Saccoglossus kowalevskii TaxID=10224 RepID=A0ABM0GRA6_SACKO|nr:PREDICTED: sexual differentiation process protein isp7-like [Saccoglossus kowalevskii]
MADVTTMLVDFSAYNLQRDSPDSNCFQKLVDDVYLALTTTGFLYLTNHGIPPDVINNAFQQSMAFFALQDEIKMKYTKSDHSNQGYVQTERESLNPEKRPGDYKEFYNYVPKIYASETEDHLLPDIELPEFKSSMSCLYHKCSELGNRILEVMARALKLEDPLLFVKAHQGIGGSDNDTTIRANWYPPISDNVQIKPNQIRCGEHSDYGSITLLFQDNIEGLQVQCQDGSFVDVPPIEGSIVMNVADIMQRWTADKFISTIHRVIMPKTEELKRSHRQSLAYFSHPDNSFVVKCVDGSDKYPPITNDVYLKQRFNATYKY